MDSNLQPNETGLKSTATLSAHLRDLQKEELIKRTIHNKKRVYIAKQLRSLPVYVTYVKAKKGVSEVLASTSVKVKVVASYKWEI